jgi:Zn ribbon nucleic-acid-binding protein
VRLHLSTKLLLDGMSDEAVTQIILLWLEPTCPFCQGRKKQLEKWSETELSDQICGGCGGTGERPVADEVEQAARSYMSECIGYAKHEIKQKARATH